MNETFPVTIIGTDERNLTILPAAGQVHQLRCLISRNTPFLDSGPCLSLLAFRLGQILSSAHAVWTHEAMSCRRGHRSTRIASSPFIFKSSLHSNGKGSYQESAACWRSCMINSGREALLCHQDFHSETLPSSLSSQVRS